MLLKLAGTREVADLRELARHIREDGRTGIWVASDLLRGEGRA
jgi:hypothetical protein